MPDKSTSVQDISREIKQLQTLRRELLSQIPESSNPFMQLAIRALEKEIKKIELKIAEAQKKLEERITANDLVSKENLEKLKKAAEGAIKGNKEEALDQLEDIGRSIVVDEVKDVIDDKVKDESIKEILKDTVDNLEEGDLEGAVDTLKDGVKEEAGELVDAHIKDPKVAALIKEVVEGVVEGDFDDLFEVVSEGVIDIAKDKLEAFVEKLLNLLRDKLHLEVEIRLKAEVRSLVDRSVVEAGQQIGVDWAIQLAAAVAKRLMKRSVAIIKEEIQLLATRETFITLLNILKDAAISTLKSGLRGRKIKDILKELLQHALQHPDFKRLVEESKDRMLRKFIDAALKEARHVTKEVLDAFMRVNGTWTGPVFNLSKKSLKIGPWWGCVNLVISASADATTSVSAARKGTGVTLTGQIAGTAYAGVGISIGYDLPIVGDISIGGGIKGGPKLNAHTTTSLVVNGNTLTGELQPLGIDLDMMALLYLDTPLPNSIVKYIPVYLPQATVVGSDIEYPLGKLSVLQLRTPSYSITVDANVKGYHYKRKSGNFSIHLNPKIKAHLESIKTSIEKASDDAWQAINPANIDLNPFDKDGWFGSLFN